MSKIFTIKIKKLRPTQFAIGRVDVDDKREKIKNFSKKKLEEYLELNPVKAVLGPEEEVYIIDRHHLSRAMYEEGETEIPAKLYGDFHELESGAFWQKMESLGFLWLFDAKGKPAKLKDLPKHIEDLADDPYRSLAWIAREEGAFQKSEVPFAEFIWANFLRTRVKIEEGKKAFRRAVDEAKLLARTDSAKNLPGFLGALPGCEEAFHSFSKVIKK